MRVAPEVVPYVQEDRWNSTQVIAAALDAEGWDEVTWQAHSLEEAQRKILAQGAAMEVLAPQKLCDQVAAEVAKMARRTRRERRRDADSNDQ